MNRSGENRPASAEAENGENRKIIARKMGQVALSQAEVEHWQKVSDLGKSIHDLEASIAAKKAELSDLMNGAGRSGIGDSTNRGAGLQTEGANGDNAANAGEAGQVSSAEQAPAAGQTATVEQGAAAEQVAAAGQGVVAEQGAAAEQAPVAEQGDTAGQASTTEQGATDGQAPTTEQGAVTGQASVAEQDSAEGGAIGAAAAAVDAGASHAEGDNATSGEGANGGATVTGETGTGEASTGTTSAGEASTGTTSAGEAGTGATAAGEAGTGAEAGSGEPGAGEPGEQQEQREGLPLSERIKALGNKLDTKAHETWRKHKKAIIGAGLAVLAASMVFGIANFRKNKDTAQISEPTAIVQQVEADTFIDERESMPNGLKYDYTKDYARFDEKKSHNSFGLDKSEYYNDVDGSIDAMMELVSNQPESLAAHLSYFPSILKQCGIDQKMSAKEIEAMLESDKENGGELQDKLLTAYESMWRDVAENNGKEGEGSYKFYREDDAEGTYYMYVMNEKEALADGKLDPTEVVLGYQVSKRDNAPQLYMQNKLGEAIDLNMNCGFQPSDTYVAPTVKQGNENPQENDGNPVEKPDDGGQQETEKPDDKPEDKPDDKPEDKPDDKPEDKPDESETPQAKDGENISRIANGGGKSNPISQMDAGEETSRPESEGTYNPETGNYEQTEGASTEAQNAGNTQVVVNPDGSVSVNVVPGQNGGPQTIENKTLEQAAAEAAQQAANETEQKAPMTDAQRDAAANEFDAALKARQ